ncbi:hypothetical protein PORUE0001_1336 [Porphyromonas uenonis 60-3]|uniref:Uncharacterized protein n=1 Tax=Porphyromonas uenonis 60-3 TaxID=596327 RepID=C2MCM0_9PORP|nr:hypothetical protein PORUE0001_1336 [Porphyromonas uenonis 60-3]
MLPALAQLSEQGSSPRGTKESHSRRSLEDPKKRYPSILVGSKATCVRGYR